MLVKCKKSCGKCPTTTGSDCKDLHDKVQCQEWALLGECDKYPDFMNAKCQKSCNKCQTKPVTKPTKPPTTISAKKPCYTPSWCFPNNKCGDGWTHELDKKCVGKGNVCCRPPPGKVYDCHSPNQCSYQKCWSNWSVVKDKTCPEPEKGFVCCKYTPTDKVTPKPTTGGMPCYQPNWCFPNNKCGDGWTHDKTKTCSGKDNVCCHPPAGKGDCKDYNANCPGWAKLGECDTNPGYMHTQCRKSCNKCTANCKNTVDDALCDEFAAKGKCDMWSMKVKCRRSCNTCNFGTK